MILGDLSVMQRRRSKRWIWWLGGLILVALIVVIAVVVVNNKNTNEETKNNNTSAQAEKKEVQTTGEKTEEKQEEVVENEKVYQYEGEDVNNKDILTGVVSYAGVNNDKLMIRVNIDQYLVEGTCSLKLKRNDNIIYTGTATIEGSVSTATCKGFDIPVAELGSGNLSIEIELDSNGKSGKIVGETTI